MTILERIFVTSTLPAGKVALWEQDARQPNGEVFVDDPTKSYEVARTPTVEAKLRLGELRELTNEELVDFPSATPEAPITDAPPDEPKIAVRQAAELVVKAIAGTAER